MRWLVALCMLATALSAVLATPGVAASSCDVTAPSCTLGPQPCPGPDDPTPNGTSACVACPDGSGPMPCHVAVCAAGVYEDSGDYRVIGGGSCPGPVADLKRQVMELVPTVINHCATGTPLVTAYCEVLGKCYVGVYASRPVEDPSDCLK